MGPFSGQGISNRNLKRRPIIEAELPIPQKSMQPHCKIRSTYFVCEWHRIKAILMFRCIDTRQYCSKNSVPPLTFKVNQSLIRKLQTRFWKHEKLDSDESLMCNLHTSIISVAHSLTT